MLGSPKLQRNLIPSWVEVFKQEDTDRAARGEAKPVQNAPFGGIMGMSGMGGGWSPQPGWATLAAIGASMPTLIEGYTPGHLERSCGVAQSYERLKADHLRSSH